MNKSIKTIISMICAAAMIVGMIGISGFNAYAEDTYNITCCSDYDGSLAFNKFTYGNSLVQSDSIIPANSNISLCAMVDGGNSTMIKIYVDKHEEQRLYASQSTSIYAGSAFIWSTNLKYINITSKGDTGEKTYSVYFETVADDSGSGSGSASVSVSPHTHNYVYTVITEPTENYDGESAWVCSCGDSKNHAVLPSLDVVMTNRVTQITSAKAGQDIVLDMGLTNSLPNWFMQKISEKNDVNFKINIKYNNKKYEISIPRGTNIDLSCDWYGPLKLMELYETTELN